MKLNICIDIDGTLTEPYYWLDMANQYFGTNVKPYEVTQYDVYKVLNIKEEEYAAFYKKYAEQVHAQAEVRKDVREILKRLNKEHNIFYVTARKPKYKEVTQNWFAKKGLPQAPLYLLGSHYKVDHAKFLNCHIFIEDRYENAVQIAEAGFQVLLIDCSYNRQSVVPGIQRVSNWKEIDQLIQEYFLKIGERSTKIA